MRGLVTMASRSDDGSLAAMLLDLLGYRVIRGSSSNGASDALRRMARMADPSHSFGLTVDGPRGPAWHVQPGVIALARWTGLPILPVAANGPGIACPSWDRLRIPLPWARCRIVVGAPIPVPLAAERMAVQSVVEDALAILQRAAGLDDRSGTP